MINLLAQAPAEPVQTSVIVANTIYLLARYLHVVCTTLLVGGTLFYEMVVPIAIADLKPEQQLAIFARARWVFRRIVWTAATMVLVTGGISAVRHWEAYTRPEVVAQRYLQRPVATTQPAYGPVTQPTFGPPVLEPSSPATHPGWWWLAHSGAGVLAILIAFLLTTGRTPPSNPVRWMRINLVVLMVVIFLASATRHVRIAVTEPSPADVPAQRQ